MTGPPVGQLPINSGLSLPPEALGYTPLVGPSASPPSPDGQMSPFETKLAPPKRPRREMGPTACFAFLSNSCHLGDKCPRSHAPDADLEVCRAYHGKLRCERGDHCNFKHGNETKWDVLQRKQSAKTAEQLGVSKNRQNTQARAPTTPTPASMNDVQLCISQFKNPPCQWGDSCPFRHSPTETVQDIELRKLRAMGGDAVPAQGGVPPPPPGQPLQQQQLFLPGAAQYADFSGMPGFLACGSAGLDGQAGVGGVVSVQGMTAMPTGQGRLPVMPGMPEYVEPPIEFPFVDLSGVAGELLSMMYRVSAMNAAAAKEISSLQPELFSNFRAIFLRDSGELPRKASTHVSALMIIEDSCAVAKLSVSHEGTDHDVVVLLANGRTQRSVREAWSIVNSLLELYQPTETDGSVKRWILQEEKIAVSHITTTVDLGVCPIVVEPTLTVGTLPTQRASPPPASPPPEYFLPMSRGPMHLPPNQQQPPPPPFQPQLLHQTDAMQQQLPPTPAMQQQQPFDMYYEEWGDGYGAAKRMRTY